MFIAQAIYKFNTNRFCRFCSRYFASNEVWFNVKNLNIVCSTVKLNDCYIKFFKIKRIFEKNSLIIKLELFASIKVYFVFYITLVNYIAIDSLFEQCQEFRKFVVVENNEKSWYINNILNFKHNKYFNSSLLKYYID